VRPTTHLSASDRLSFGQPLVARVAGPGTSHIRRGERALDGNPHELAASADTGLVKQLLKRRLAA